MQLLKTLIYISLHVFTRKIIILSLLLQIKNTEKEINLKGVNANRRL